MRILQKAEGVDWLIWRLVISPDIPDGLAAIRSNWSLLEVIEGHKVLDALEGLREHHQRKAERGKNGRL